MEMADMANVTGHDQESGNSPWVQELEPSRYQSSLAFPRYTPNGTPLVYHDLGLPGTLIYHSEHHIIPVILPSIFHCHLFSSQLPLSKHTW
jgi:hypothetical protein